MAEYQICPKCGQWGYLFLNWEARWCKDCIDDETARIQAEVEIDIEGMEGDGN